LRAFVLTPDYPPTVGGIQTLLSQIVAHATTLEPTVLTLHHPDASAHDAAQPYAVHRAADGRLPHQARMAVLNAAAVRLGRRLRPDVVLSGHVTCGPAAAMLHRRFGIPYVQYLHANEIGGRPGLTRFAGQRAARVIAVSRYTATEAAAIGITPERIVVIPPGTEPRPAALRVPAERPTMVTVARMKDAYKGHDILLDALPAVRAAVPDVHWVIIGDGPLRPQLEARAATEGLASSVTFLGRAPDAERDRWLDSAWVLANPSRLPGGNLMGEGFGIVFTEASARGLPVVAGNVAGALDAVAHDRSGLLVDPTDPAAVADALIRVLTDRPLGERLSQGGRDFAAGIAWPLIARRVEAELAHAARLAA
jgi:phosphatidylinositol alpha-1,6-mannosyltransferase